MRRVIKTVLAMSLMGVAGEVWSADSQIIRYTKPDAALPIATAVEIPASASLVYLSGTVPSVAKNDRDKHRLKAYAGDTEDQTVDVLRGIERKLKELGLRMRDIVKMQVYLTGDPTLEGEMDFAGFMRAYSGFFGTEDQPNVPARSVFQVAGLADPSWLVEIEVVAVRPAARVR